MNIIEHNIDMPGYGMMKAAVVGRGEILNLEELERDATLQDRDDRYDVGRLLGDFRGYKVYQMGWVHPEYYLAVVDSTGRVVWEGSISKDKALYWVEERQVFEAAPTWAEWTDPWEKVTEFGPGLKLV